MTNGFIQLSEVLDTMKQFDETGKPVSFQVKFITADRKLKTGGEIINIPSGRYCIGKRNGEVVFDSRQPSGNSEVSRRDPHHWSNATRNILLPNGRICALHIRLIIEFNHKKVFF